MKRVSVQLPPDVVDALDEEAEENDTSRSSVIRNKVMRAVHAEGAPHAGPEQVAELREELERVREQMHEERERRIRFEEQTDHLEAEYDILEDQFESELEAKEEENRKLQNQLTMQDTVDEKIDILADRYDDRMDALATRIENRIEDLAENIEQTQQTSNAPFWVRWYRYYFGGDTVSPPAEGTRD